MSTKYIIINESNFDGSVTQENVSLWSTYNRALTALDDLAREYDIVLDLEDSSFVKIDGNTTNEFYIDSLEEDHA